MTKEDTLAYFKKKRKDFPLFSKQKNLIYFDNSATSQKPKVMIDSLVDFYENYNSNVHRGIHRLSEKATDEYEKSRKKVAHFINSDPKEVVFTKGTTESINLLAFGLEEQLKEGDEIIVSTMEHHANLVPWQVLCKRSGAKLKLIPLDNGGRLDMMRLEKSLSEKTKIVALSHVSNVLGTINDVEKITKLAHQYGAIVFFDGAQAVPHMKVDMKKIGCDFYAFSAHKMYGPTGVGILYGKYEKLKHLRPLNYGGSMIREVREQVSTLADAPFVFEAGTPNIADIIAFSATLDYLGVIDYKKLEEYEQIMVRHFLDKAKKIKGLEIYGPIDPKNRCAVFSINLKGVHAQDLSLVLDKYNVAVRAGHHCAMPLSSALGIESTARVSMCFYNTLEEIDRFFEVLEKAKDMF